MTKIYLIRHAEAEGNLYRRIQGHFDGLVTERGKKQISVLAERFKDIDIDALYSSDLVRTKLTSEAITKYHDIEPSYLKSLREICMGVWEDRAWETWNSSRPNSFLFSAGTRTNGMLKAEKNSQMSKNA